MKNTIFIATLLLFSTATFAQSGNPKIDNMLAKLMNGMKGKITYTINGKTISEAIVITKDANKSRYLLIADPVKGIKTIACSFSDKSGTYSFSKNNDWVLEATNIFSLQGTANISISANKISGTFQGDVYPPDKKGKFSKIKSGTSSGSFTASL